MSLAQEYKQEARSSSENSKILTTASSVRINKTSSGLGNSFALSLLLKWLHRVYQAWLLRNILFFFSEPSSDKNLRLNNLVFYLKFKHCDY
jgi:hypothetical protein